MTHQQPQRQTPVIGKTHIVDQSDVTIHEEENRGRVHSALPEQAGFSPDGKKVVVADQRYRRQV